MGISGDQLLIVLTLGGFVYLLVALIRGGRLRAWITRISEASVFRELAPPRARDVDESAPSSSVPFPLALGVIGVLGVAHLAVWVWMLSFHGPVTGYWSDEITRVFARSAGPHFIAPRLVAAVLGMAIMVGALRLHFRPAHNRRRKYELLLISASCLGLGILESYVDIANRLTVEPPPVSALSGLMPSNYPIGNEYVLSAILIALNPALILLVLSGVSAGRKRHVAATDGALPDPRDLGRLRWVRRLAVPAVILFVFHPVILLYLWSRYWVLDRFSCRPILYFRSFRYADGPTAFGRIVSKAARHYGVLMAIVHESQTGSSLQRLTGFADQANTAVLPDQEWQAWVLKRLETASAVIIDATELSESLAWELDAARTRVGVDRILVLVGKGADTALSEDIATLEYDLDDKSSVRSSTSKLREWFNERLGRAEEPV